MKVTRRVTQTQEVDHVIGHICNACGDSCTPPNARSMGGTPVKYVEGEGLVEITEEESLLLRGPDSYGLIEVTVSGGYHSFTLEDLTQYTFSMCEGCLKKLFDTFKIPPETLDLMP